MPNHHEKEGNIVELTLEDRKILQILQGDIPLHAHPFASLGKSLNLQEDDVMRIIHKLREKGIIRKLGAVLRHCQAGFTQNAMVVWHVPESRIETTGMILASFPEVSHCYERTPSFDGKYNVFTMVHLKTPDIPVQVRKMAEAAGLDDYQILISAIEYKKSSMVYFRDRNSEND
jgi:DNA-binding Lrp family transcriptional regulator